MSDEEHPPWWHADAEGPDGEPNPVDVGTAAQEAVKLAASVAAWAEQSGLSDTLRGIAEQATVSMRAAARTASSATTARDVDDDVDVVFEAPGEPPQSSQTEGHESQAEYPERTTCDSCPICQGMDLIKTVSPEAANGITDALAAVTAAVKQAVDGFGSSGSRSSAKVEHIDID